MYILAVNQQGLQRSNAARQRPDVVAQASIELASLAIVDYGSCVTNEQGAQAEHIGEYLGQARQRRLADATAAKVHERISVRIH